MSSLVATALVSRQFKKAITADVTSRCTIYYGQSMTFPLSSETVHLLINQISNLTASVSLPSQQGPAILLACECYNNVAS